MLHSCPPVDFDRRLVLFLDRELQAIADAERSSTSDGLLDGIAAFHYSPFLPEKQLGTLHGSQPWQAIGDTEGLAQRYSHFAIDSGEIVAARCDDTGTPHVMRPEILRG